MSSFALHHVEMCVKEENKVLSVLTQGFGFHLLARRLTPRASTWALRSGNSVFTVTKRNSFLECENKQRNDLAIENIKYKYPSKIEHNSSIDKLNADNNMEEDQGFCSTEHLQNFPKNHICKETDSKEKLNQCSEHWTVFCCRDESVHSIDSVFNLALVVKDVDSVTEHVRSLRGQVLREPSDISDMYGQVRYSIVTSCCGNIVHTVLDTKNYEGVFLPGYEIIKECNRSIRVDTPLTNENDEHLSVNWVVSVNNSDAPSFKKDSKMSNGIPKQAQVQESIASVNNAYPRGRNTHSFATAPITTNIDHVTYVCEAGSSQALMNWYENCFGMKRFKTNSEETDEHGFVLGGNIGLRLKALEYWRCAETGLAVPSASTSEFSLKLVIAEPLPNVSRSHVNTFLKEHNGPGVQHIALHTSSITATVKYMSENGVVFRKPPPVYYQEGIKLEEIEEAGHGEDIDLFQELGILLDTERDAFADTKAHGQKRYLMQIFTKPVFEEETFFLEIIQRCGAMGFGAGNITALAKSIMLYHQELEKSSIKTLHD